MATWKRNIDSCVLTPSWLCYEPTCHWNCIEYLLSSHSRCLINIWMIKHISSLFKMKDESSGSALSWWQLSLHFLFRGCFLCVPAGFSGRQLWIERRTLPIGAPVGSCKFSSVIFHITLNTLQSSVRSTQHPQNQSFRSSPGVKNLSF